MARAADGPPSADMRANRVGDAAPDVVHRQLDADDAGRRDEDGMAVQRQCLCSRGGHFLGVLHAVRPGARVGAAAVDHNRADPPRRLGKVRARHQHWRCLREVGREDSRGRGRNVGCDHREVQPLACLDAAGDARGPEAARRRDAAVDLLVNVAH